MWRRTQKKGGRDPDQVSANSAKSASSHHLAKCEVPSKIRPPISIDIYCRNDNTNHLVHVALTRPCQSDINFPQTHQSSAMATSGGANDAGLASEQTPLLLGAVGPDIISSSDVSPHASTTSGSGLDATDPNLPTRHKIYLILEGRYGAIGAAYEKVTIVLILASIVAFVVGSLFDPVYNADAEYLDMCGKVCDAIFFGQNSDNGESRWWRFILSCPFATCMSSYLQMNFRISTSQASASLASGSLLHRFWRSLPLLCLLSTISSDL